MNWSPEQWRKSLTGMRELGCEEVFLQWVGIEGESNATWDARGRMLGTLMNEAAGLGMGVHLGLPYNDNWWNAIPENNDAVYAYLQGIGQHCASYMRSVTWQKSPAFRGWYIPYELEQYHWGSAARIDMLTGWLGALSNVCVETSGREPTISTYHSEMGSPEVLAQMWSVILDRVRIHPMLQDGVGVHGIGNYANLEPLHQMLLRRGASFDLIVELFERLPTSANLVGEFQARSASYNRLMSQWHAAKDYGAKRVVAFAVEPWVSQDTAEGQQLRKAWRATLQQQQVDLK